MKFSIPKVALQELLQIVGSAVPAKSTLPILGNVLIEAKRDGLTMVATDLDLSIRTRGEADVTEEGTITVPAKRIAEIVRELPENDVKVSLANNKVKLTCGNGTFSIVAQNAEDFPQLPQVESGKTVSLPTSVLEKGVRRAAYAVSSDETRQMLTGVLVQILDGEIRMVATDGHRLAKAAFRGPHKSMEARDLIITPKALNAVVRLSAGHDTVSLAVSKNFAIFEMGPSTLFSRLIDGNFPNYEQVVPKESPRRFNVRRDELIAALRRVVVLSDNQTRQIKLTVKPERIELSVNTADVGEGHESIPVEYTGEPLSIGYNAAYLLEALRTMDGEQVTVRLNTPTSPGVLIPMTQAENEDLLCLVMPLRLPEG